MRFLEERLQILNIGQMLAKHRWEMITLRAQLPKHMSILCLHILQLYIASLPAKKQVQNL